MDIIIFVLLSSKKKKKKTYQHKSFQGDYEGVFN